MILHNFLYGLIIGLGFIIPGVSGGVLATILGIYDEIIKRILNINKNFKNNLLYLTPIIIGILISILLFSKIILYLLDNRLMFISYVFIGLILGCIPYLIKEIKSKTNKNISLISFIIALVIGLFLYLFQKKTTEIISSPSILKMSIAGIFYAIGKIVPGISGAALLMFLGIYKYFLSIISNPLAINIHTIIIFIPFIITFIISGYLILKLINYLLNNHFCHTYSAIIGFIISSILFIYPGNINIISIIIAILSFIISYYLSN